MEASSPTPSYAASAAGGPFGSSLSFSSPSFDSARDSFASSSFSSSGLTESFDIIDRLPMSEYEEILSLRWHIFDITTPSRSRRTDDGTMTRPPSSGGSSPEQLPQKKKKKKKLFELKSDSRTAKLLTRMWGGRPSRFGFKPRLIRAPGRLAPIGPVTSSIVDDVDDKQPEAFQNGENGSKFRSPSSATDHQVSSASDLQVSSASKHQVEGEWVEQYEPGVFITLVALRDGTRDLMRVRFSRKRFGEQQAEIWWSENRERVYEKYNVRVLDEASTALSSQSAPIGTLTSSIVNDGDDKQPEAFQNCENGSKFRSPSSATDHQVSSASDLQVSSASDHQVEDEWIEQYEPGVYITLMALRGGTRDLKCVRFRFGEQQADTWWSENRERVYEKFNVRVLDEASTSLSSQSACRSEEEFLPSTQTQ